MRPLQPKQGSNTHYGNYCWQTLDDMLLTIISVWYKKVICDPAEIIQSYVSDWIIDRNIWDKDQDQRLINPINADFKIRVELNPNTLIGMNLPIRVDEFTIKRSCLIFDPMLRATYKNPDRFFGYLKDQTKIKIEKATYIPPPILNLIKGYKIHPLLIKACYRSLGSAIKSNDRIAGKDIFYMCGE